MKRQTHWADELQKSRARHDKAMSKASRSESKATSSQEEMEGLTAEVEKAAYLQFSGLSRLVIVTLPQLFFSIFASGLACEKGFQPQVKGALKMVEPDVAAALNLRDAAVKHFMACLVLFISLVCGCGLLFLRL